MAWLLKHARPPDPAGAEALGGTGVDSAINPTERIDVDASAPMPLTVVSEVDGLPLETVVDGVGGTVIKILEVTDENNAYGMAAPMPEDDSPLPEAPADQVADVPMPHAGLINSVSAIGEGPIVSELTAPVTLDLSRAELFSTVRVERMLGTDVVLSRRDSGVLDDADASTRVLSPAADDDGLLLRTCVEGAGAAALTIIEVMKDVGPRWLRRRRLRMLCH